MQQHSSLHLFEPRSQRFATATKCSKRLDGLFNASVNAATSRIIIGGQTVYLSFQLARIAMPNTISDSMSTQAKNIGAGNPIWLSMPGTNQPLSPGLMSPQSFAIPGTSMSSPSRMRLIIILYVLYEYAKNKVLEVAKAQLVN